MPERQDAQTKSCQKGTRCYRLASNARNLQATGTVTAVTFAILSMQPWGLSGGHHHRLAEPAQSDQSAARQTAMVLNLKADERSQRYEY